MRQTTTKSMNESTKGAAYAAFSYVLWGILPIYWKCIAEIPSDQILAERMVWSFVFMTGVLIITGKREAFLSTLRALLSRPAGWLPLVASSLLITANWYTYIWAVNHDRLIDASLGYYMNPLISVLLATLVLKERLNKLQWISVLTALIGVVIMTLRVGSFPWIALLLAVTFAVYGLSKKLTAFDSETGLTLETLTVTPFALAFLCALLWRGDLQLGNHWWSAILLAGSGAVTATPLLLFAKGAVRIPLAMVGFLQYIAPTISLFLGIFAYHEHFSTGHFIAFAFIWCSLLLFTVSNLREAIKRNRQEG